MRSERIIKQTNKPVDKAGGNSFRREHVLSCSAAAAKEARADGSSTAIEAERMQCGLWISLIHSNKLNNYGLIWIRIL